jgi:putative oxidoreductase
LESKGFIAGVAIVWILTAFEIIGGLMMAIGYYTRWMAAGFILILLIGIVLIHAELGWFVGEHGTGGVEYSVVLIAALVVIAASAKK